MVLPVIFLSMAVLLTVFFVCLSAISENSKIHIGVVVPEKGFMERGLLSMSAIWQTRKPYVCSGS